MALPRISIISLLIAATASIGFAQEASDSDQFPALLFTHNAQKAAANRDSEATSDLVAVESRYKVVAKPEPYKPLRPAPPLDNVDPPRSFSSTAKPKIGNKKNKYDDADVIYPTTTYRPVKLYLPTATARSPNSQEVKYIPAFNKKKPKAEEQGKKSKSRNKRRKKGRKILKSVVKERRQKEKQRKLALQKKKQEEKRKQLEAALKIRKQQAEQLQLQEETREREQYRSVPFKSSIFPAKDDNNNKRNN